MAGRDPLFAKELEGLTADQRQWLEDELGVRYMHAGRHERRPPAEP
jgi:hypothetical protein